MADGPLPPGQYVPREWPVLHYGPVPKFRPDRWDLRIFGATADGLEQHWCWDEVAAMPRTEVVADFHCVTKFSIQQVRWAGVSTEYLGEKAPPAPEVTHIMVWAEYGYSANLRVADFFAGQTLLASRRDGEELEPDQGHPLRLVVPHLYGWKSVKWVRGIEYLTADRRGFWEERGYHNIADPWREQRYSYMEQEGDGPPLR